MTLRLCNDLYATTINILYKIKVIMDIKTVVSIQLVEEPCF